MKFVFRIFIDSESLSVLPDACRPASHQTITLTNHWTNHQFTEKSEW